METRPEAERAEPERRHDLPSRQVCYITRSDGWSTFGQIVFAFGVAFVASALLVKLLRKADLA
jgi:hypothetical protein